jgi:hypothetical protein
MIKYYNMEDNGKCIILKRKEYDELLTKANTPKSEKISLIYSNYKYSKNSFLHVEGSIDLSENITSQIRKFHRSIIEEVKNQNTLIKADLVEEFKKMSWRERRKFLKQHE